MRGSVVGSDYDVSCVRVMTMSEEIADGHVSKFIAPGLMGLGECRETVFRAWVWADVFGTRQEYILAFTAGVK